MAIERYHGKGHIGAGQYDLDVWAHRPVCPFDKYVMKTSIADVLFRPPNRNEQVMQCGQADCPHCGARFMQAYMFWHYLGDFKEL